MFYWLGEWQWSHEINVLIFYHFNNATHSTFNLSVCPGVEFMIYLRLKVRTTPRRMMMNMRIPAITPAIFTVLSTCFSGSMASESWVDAPTHTRAHAHTHTHTHTHAHTGMHKVTLIGNYIQIALHVHSQSQTHTQHSHTHS